jgi:NDP-sugar pyrophosphorylase family protein
MVEKSTIPAVILAGGLGTRLWPITDMYEKALVPVGGKSCICWVIEELHNQGFRKLTVCINDEKRKDFEYALDKFEVEISEAPAATSACARILRNRIKIENCDRFFVIYADDLTHTNYSDLVNQMDVTKADVVLAVTGSVDLEFGLIDTDDVFVTSFNEKPNLKQFTNLPIWTGRALLKSNLLLELLGRSDLARNVFPELLRQRKRLAVVNGDAPWYDVGSIAHWRRANEHYAKSA